MMLSHESRIYDHELYNEPLVCAQLIILAFFYSAAHHLNEA